MERNAGMDRIKLKKEILSEIESPHIGDNVLDAASVSILPDSGELQTEKLQAAIDRLSGEGGGRLSLPAGTYLTGALELKSGVELHLASMDTVLRFTTDDIAKNYPLVYSHWEGSPCYNYSALIYAKGASDIAVTGEGTLDGGADDSHWWNWHHQVEKSWSSDSPDLQAEDRKALRRMNIEGVPVEKRIFGEGHFLRPNFIQFIDCDRVLIRGVTLRNSPMWQLNPVLCRSLIIEHVHLSSHGYNNDGCDPESCRGVWIKNCLFDSGDDCISLKSGRDRDGRLENTPTSHVLIEDNVFADGHGGIALGSEMSGGIHTVLADGNRFDSLNLTYALRLKTNARRGGRVERIMLCNSVMPHVHGAAIHGTMLYEDGRDGTDLPVFQDIVVENVTARGGDYGIFLEAFPEVPIRGLVLRNITITDAVRELRSMNWDHAVMENVMINGFRYPRPGKIRILGTPRPGSTVSGEAECLGGELKLSFDWLVSADGKEWKPAGNGKTFTVPEECSGFLQLSVKDENGNVGTSIAYRILEPADADGQTEAGLSGVIDRLRCRGLLEETAAKTGRIMAEADSPITRTGLSEMLMPLAAVIPSEDGETAAECRMPVDTDRLCDRTAVCNSFLSLDAENRFRPLETVTRQEMATVAMEACGVNYRNASSTMPNCLDRDSIPANFGTNIARSLYFGFMTTEDGYFRPDRIVSRGEAMVIIDRIADFAGL